MEGFRGLEAQWGQLCLCKDEKETILVEEDFPELDKTKKKRSVVGKIWADMFIGREAIKGTMGKI